MVDAHFYDVRLATKKHPSSIPQTQHGFTSVNKFYEKALVKAKEQRKKISPKERAKRFDSSMISIFGDSKSEHPFLGPRRIV